MSGQAESVQANELLEGQKVLEWVDDQQPLLVHVAVSFATRLLADLGATVYRVTPANDPLVFLKSDEREVVGTSSLLSAFLGRAKTPLQLSTLDGFLRSSDPSSLLLVAGGNGSQSTPSLTDLPRVIASCAVDDAQSAVSELSIQGLVGLTDLFGEPGEQPLMLGGHQSAYATGYAIFCAAMANLTKQRFLGQVDEAQVSALDALAWVNWKGVAAGTLGFPVERGGKGADAPVLQCANGYFAFLHMPNNWPDICAEVSDPLLDDEQFSRPGRRAKNARALNDILAAWAADKSWQYLYEFCKRCAIPGGPVLRGTDLLKDPLYQHRDFMQTAACDVGGQPKDVTFPGLPVKVECAAEGSVFAVPQRRRFSPNTPDNLPLSGKLVIDLGIYTAGSVTSTLLADLGATVIKVESASYSDPFRIWPGIKGDSPLFTFNNRNKLGLNLDLKTDSGRAQFFKLVAEADVVVENFRRGVLDRLQINFAALSALNPAIVLASVSGQGASGPGSEHVSFGTTLEAIGGVAGLTGYPGKGCYVSGRNLNYPDQIVCLYGAGAVMAAMQRAQASGKGLHIDVSQREVTTLAVGEAVAAASVFGDRPDFPGNSDLNAVLQDIYGTKDGWLCLTVADEEQLHAIATVLDLTADKVTTELPQWLRERSCVDAIEQFQPLGVAVCRANTGGEAAQEPAVQQGNAFAVTRAGDMVKGFPFQFVNTPLSIYEESPAIGEHSEHILKLLEETV